MVITDKEGQVRSEAADLFDEKVKEISVFNATREREVPRIDPGELEDGKFLGEGGFCTVTELKSLTLFNKNLDDSKVDKNLTLQDRQFMSTHFLRDGHARYAIKRLSRGLMKTSEDYFLAGIIDLAMEAKYLAVIQHPHIIKMRATSCTHPCSDSFFLVLDKLYDTLADRVESWGKDKRSLSGLLSSGTKKNEHFANRLIVAYDICSALFFLHNNNVIYRDLKPDNIGFDIRDDVKIFDFGLAKEMKTSDQVKSTNTYNLTAEAGSPRYMAPEVALGQPYNHKVDVYSFALVLWQMCALKAPFADHTIESMTANVYKGNERPDIKSKWPSTVETLIKKCWSRNAEKRPESEEAMNSLREDISTLCDSETAAKLDCSCRTAYSISAT